MRPPGPAVALLVLLPLLLAGCTGAAKPAEEPPAATVATITAQPNRGILLRVLVITDEYFPVPDAKVVLMGLGVNGTTDDWGDAYFHVAKPGRYALHVHRAGFYPNETRVVLEEGTPNPVVRVRLVDAPRDGHYSDFFYYNGLCGQTVYVQATSDSSNCGETPNFPKPEGRFILGRGLTYGYVELNWQRNPAGPQAMRMEIRFPDAGPFADGTDVLVAEGPTPVKIRIPGDLLTDRHQSNGHTVTVKVGLARGDLAAANVQQEFTIEAQFDYFLQAPDVDAES